MNYEPWKPASQVAEPLTLEKVEREWKRLDSQRVVRMFNGDEVAEAWAHGAVVRYRYGAPHPSGKNRHERRAEAARQRADKRHGRAAARALRADPPGGFRTPPWEATWAPGIWSGKPSK